MGRMEGAGALRTAALAALPLDAILRDDCVRAMRLLPDRSMKIFA